MTVFGFVLFSVVSWITFLESLQTAARASTVQHLIGCAMVLARVNSTPSSSSRRIGSPATMLINGALVEELTKWHTQLIFLQNPFGDTPQGKLLTQMQSMIAEYERAQITERMRRGKMEKARRGDYIPWAYSCYGYRYLPKRHGSPPQVMIEPEEAASRAPDFSAAGGATTLLSPDYQTAH